MAIYLHKYFPKLSDSFLLLGLLSPCANPPIMALFNAALSKNRYFHFFCFKCVSVPMIILNEHMHSNMIDVYQEKQEWHSGNVPIIWTSFHQKEITKRNAFLSKFLKKIFSSKEVLFPSMFVPDYYLQKA